MILTITVWPKFGHDFDHQSVNIVKLTTTQRVEGVVLEIGIMPLEGSQTGVGTAVLEVRFADGIWYRGRLVERVAGSKSPR